MPQSLARIHVHLVFSTKNRYPFLMDTIRSSLHAYVAAVLKSLGCPAIVINSVEDHIHILFNLSRTVTMSKVVEDVKKSSSKWIKTQDAGLPRFSWQAGYGAFSVSESQVDSVRVYITRQREHHAKVAFKEEFKSLLIASNVDYDERYVWD